MSTQIHFPLPKLQLIYCVLRLKRIRKTRFTISIHEVNNAVDQTTRWGKIILVETLSRPMVFEIPVSAPLMSCILDNDYKSVSLVYAHYNICVLRTYLFRRNVPSHVIRCPCLANAVTMPPVTVYEFRPATAALDPLKLNTRGITHV